MKKKLMKLVLFTLLLAFSLRLAGTELRAETGTAGSTITDEATISDVVTTETPEGSELTTTEEETVSSDVVETEPEEPEEPAFVTGMQKIDGSWYYVNEDGTYLTGWYKADNGDRYYFDKDGVRVNGKVTIGSYTYYFKKGVEQKSVWYKADDGTKYYFNCNGHMVTGLKKIHGERYYFSVHGKMKTGWRTIDGKKYYFYKKSGKAMTGKKFFSHYLCYFSNKGVLQRRIDTKKKMVAVTYDDGPSIYTPTVLNVLEQNDAVATFFLVGSRVASYSSYVKRAYNLGCQIGNHTWEHVYLTSVGAGTIQSQVSRTNAAIKKVIGVSPIVMRPPGGCVNTTVRNNVGMPMILWSIDTRDWEHRNTQKTINSVLSNVKDGDIILMHDLYQSTANAAKTIIPSLINRGYQLVTISELAQCKGKTLSNGVSYFSF